MMKVRRREFLKQLGYGGAGLGLAGALPGRSWAERVGRVEELPRSSPEAQGMDSSAIVALLDAIAASNHEFHSLMVLRHGHVVAEGWWSPYRPEYNQSLYSLSKSFTSTAVGLAVSEGKLRVDDSVTSFFPEDLPDQVSKNLAALQVKHLLTMSVGHAADSTPAIVKEDNWVKAFLALPVPHEPGTVFLYNSGASYMLSAIVQKVTRERVLDYLAPRLFEPLGIEGMTWETCPRGINTGGWGLSVRTQGLARFAQLYLRNGHWHGHALLPEAWVEEATSFKIQQAGKDLERLKEESDWHQGYCYQFWRCRHGAFRGDGAFGQFAIVMPRQDAAVVITSETSDMQGELNLIWKHLLPAMYPVALDRNEAAHAELKRRLSLLALPAPSGGVPAPIGAIVSDRPFRLDSNDIGAQTVTFGFRDSDCVFDLTEAQANHRIVCGHGVWVDGETRLPGTPRLIPGPSSSASKIAACGCWKNATTYEMTWQYPETPHHDTVVCRFTANRVRIEFISSIRQRNPNWKDQRPVLEGTIASA